MKDYLLTLFIDITEMERKDILRVITEYIAFPHFAIYENVLTIEASVHEYVPKNVIKKLLKDIPDIRFTGNILNRNIGYVSSFYGINGKLKIVTHKLKEQ
jgi:hypothetical protein